MRNDLPAPVARQLEWQRRALVREIGRMYNELIDAHIDPTPWLKGIRQEFARAMEEDRAA